MTGQRVTSQQCRVLLALSLEGQHVSDIGERVMKSGGPLDPNTLKIILKRLVGQDLAHMEQQGRALYFRLSTGPAVEDALDKAWAVVQASA
jgi:predicted transcriptional regulator